MRREYRDSPADHRIDEEAIDWLMKEDRGLTSDETAEFAHWLASDERCRERYENHKRNWLNIDPIVTSGSPEVFEQAVAAQVRRNTIKRRSWVALAGGLAAVLAFFLWPQLFTLEVEQIVPDRQFFTSNQYENQILSDGSIVELNQQSRIQVNFTSKERTVWLLQGEAHFHVARDLETPFTVHAGEAEIRALGTAFNVLLSEEVVDVLVTEGKVSVLESGYDEAASPSKVAPSNNLEMVANQRTTLIRDSSDRQSRISTLSHQQMNELLAWKPKTLEFSATPLGEVIVAFNKRNDVQLIVDDPRLAAMRIEATFQSDKVENFVRLLELTFGIKHRQLDDYRMQLYKTD